MPLSQGAVTRHHNNDFRVYAQDLNDPHSKKRPLLHLRSWSTVKDVKDRLSSHLRIPSRDIVVYFGVKGGRAGGGLRNGWTLEDCGVVRSGEVLLFDTRGGRNDAGMGLGGTTRNCLSSNCLSAMAGGGQGGSNNNNNINNNASDSINGNNSNNNGNGNGNGNAHSNRYSSSSSSSSSFSNSGFFTGASTPGIQVVNSLLDKTPKKLLSTLRAVQLGLQTGYKPKQTLDGSGGTYFLQDSVGGKKAVFKPGDEEPFAAHNPHSYLPFNNVGEMCDNSMRAGIVPGEACHREVAAYLLDHGGFSSVPMTTLAEARHRAFNINGSQLSLGQGGAGVGGHALMRAKMNIKASTSTPDLADIAGAGLGAARIVRAKSMEIPLKLGSFQQFVKAKCSMDDISSTLLPVDEVHKIAILDIRLMNADRNAANLLCKQKETADGTPQYSLVPIDHGYCLRSKCDVSWFDWCWYDWPQLKEPLSAKAKKYINSLNIDEDAKLLKERLNLDDEAIKFFRASNHLLITAVNAGLTLYQIASLCCRTDNFGEVPSKLEVMTTRAKELSHAAVENGKFHHIKASRAIVDTLSAPPKTENKIVSSPKSIFVSSSPSEPIPDSPTALSSSGSDSSGGGGMMDAAPVLSKFVEGNSDASEPPADTATWAAEVLQSTEALINTSLMSSPSSLSSSQDFVSRGRSLSQSSLDESSPTYSSTPKSPPGFWKKKKPTDKSTQSTSPTVCWDDSDIDDDNDNDLYEEDTESDTDTTDTPPTLVLPPPPPSLEKHHKRNGSGNTSTASLSPRPTLLVRSQSYSALTKLSSPKSKFSRLSTLAGEAFDDEKLRVGLEYYHKFVGLLIEKELQGVCSRE